MIQYFWNTLYKAIIWGIIWLFVFNYFWNYVNILFYHINFWLFYLASQLLSDVTIRAAEILVIALIFLKIFKPSK